MDLSFLQELCMYQSEFHKLLSLGGSTDMMATSAMDESVHKLLSPGGSTDMIATSAMDESVYRVGRPFGGCAIVWSASLKGSISITKIECPCNQICAITYTYNNVSILLLNCYMPYDKFADKGEYIDVLNVISQLLYTLNPSHVIIGGTLVI